MPEIVENENFKVGDVIYFLYNDADLDKDINLQLRSYVISEYDLVALNSGYTYYTKDKNKVVEMAKKDFCQRNEAAITNANTYHQNVLARLERRKEDFMHALELYEKEQTNA